MRRMTVINVGAIFVWFVAASFATVLFTAVAAWSQTNAPVERITDGPVVKNITGTGAEIAWSTDAPGSSIVTYGTSPNDLSQTAEAPWGGTKEPNGDYNHSVWITNLRPNMTYYFVVHTTQGAVTGTQTKSQVQEFQTNQ
jgi:hypothetical protein